MYDVPFVSAEGLDGAGKSNAIDIIEEELIKAGFKVKRTREPGGTPLAEKLRSLLKYHNEERVNVRTETNLFFAARIQNVEEVIKPNLENKVAVISDRFSDSTVAYQTARGQDKDQVLAVKKASLGDFKPDLTLFLDINLITSNARIHGRNIKNDEIEKTDNFEKNANDYFNKVRDIYLDIAKEDPKRVKVINAMDSIEEVSENIRKVVKQFIHEFKLNLKNENRKSLKM